MLFAFSRVIGPIPIDRVLPWYVPYKGCGMIAFAFVVRFTKEGELWDAASI